MCNILLRNLCEVHKRGRWQSVFEKKNDKMFASREKRIGKNVGDDYWLGGCVFYRVYRPALGKMWLTTIMRNINFVVDPNVWTGLTPLFFRVRGFCRRIREKFDNYDLTLQIIVDVGNKKSRNNLMWLKGKLSYNDAIMMVDDVTLTSFR